MEKVYGLCDVIDYDGAVCVPIVHGCQRLVSLLACRVPYLKLDCGGFVEGDCLGEESGADGRFSVVIELVLPNDQYHVRFFKLERLFHTYLDESQY